MFEKFLKEEKARADIESIILAVGIIISAVFVLIIYSSALEAMNSCVDHPRCPE